MMNPTKIQTINETIEYISKLIGKENAAYEIVCLVANPNFDSWYSKYHDFAKIFDLASELELNSDVNKWRDIKKLLVSLTKQVHT